MMASSSNHLSFDCKPQIFSMLQKACGDQDTRKIEEFLASLEEERLKIDAFKRELPLCMQLLNNAMEASRQQLQTERARPVLEQFIPLKNPNSSNVETNEGDKANWMTSAQLWNQESEGVKTPKSPQETDTKLGLIHGKHRMNGGGAFLPFLSKERGDSPSGEGFPELALAPVRKEEVEEKRNLSSSETKRERCGSGSVENKEKEGNGSQTHRKARRCWSPDLHRRFVNALHMLGGSQVATPKQIRELMKVDGLTNDEVKSHLQKYRLHTRRPSPGPQATSAAAPQVVFLGGIWVPPEYASHGGAPSAALYGAHPAHHVPPPFCSPTPQDHVYPTIAPPPNHHHAAVHHQQLHLYNKPPVMTESDIRGGGGGGDASESIEDGKSESGSWKADSGGDNSGERRRAEGEESLRF